MSCLIIAVTTSFYMAAVVNCLYMAGNYISGEACIFIEDKKIPGTDIRCSVYLSRGMRNDRKIQVFSLLIKNSREELRPGAKRWLHQ